MRCYIALIHKEGDSDYGVSFPDLPGLISAGSTLDEARDMAADALSLHLAGMGVEGEAIPEPSSLEAIMADRENREAVAILVPAPAGAARAVRVNITVPEDALQAFDKFAEAHGLTRSGFLVEAGKRALERA